MGTVHRAAIGSLPNNTGALGTSRSFRFEEGTPSRSKPVHKIAYAHAQSLGHAQKSMKTDPLLSALDLSDVNRMQIGFFCELFLAHACSIAVVADRLSNDLEMWFGPRHGCLEKQDGEPRNTPNMGVFALAPLSAADTFSSKAPTCGVVCEHG
jgi:hypothetical protein